MRDIKFRAWFPAGTDTGDGEIEKGEMCYALAFEEYEPINDLLKGVEYLMQYTGLKDKNGKEIYEGDILSTGEDNEREVVEWDTAEGCFVGAVWAYDEIETEGGADCGLTGPFCEIEKLGFHEQSDTRTWAEVIGNIYENPELLTGQAENAREAAQESAGLDSLDRGAK